MTDLDLPDDEVQIAKKGKQKFNREKRKRRLKNMKKKMKLPSEIDLLDKQNRPQKGKPSTILRFLRILSLWVLAFALIASFGYSIVLSANGFNTPDLQELREVISYGLSFWALSGFLLLGIASEGKDKAREIEEIIQKRRKKMMELGLTEEQAKLVEEEFTPVEKKGKKAKLFFFSMAVVCLSTYGIFYFITGNSYHPLATYGLVGAVISVGFILSGFAGEINVEIWRFHILGLHIHEAAVGIFFIIVSVPLLYFGASVDRILAAFYFFVGAYLMGRDWRDVSAGKIIERQIDDGVEKEDSKSQENTL